MVVLSRFRVFVGVWDWSSQCFHSGLAVTIIRFIAVDRMVRLSYIDTTHAAMCETVYI